jgi:hypothetical protein
MWEDNIMKRKYGLRSVTLFLSICVSVCSACFCVLLMAGEYYTARHKLDIFIKESQGWEACRQTEPTYFKTNEEAVSSCLKNLEEAKDNFWVKLPKNKAIGLFVLASLGSAIGGYLVVWSVWFVCLGIYRFIRWMKCCLQSKIFLISHKDKDYDINKEVEELEHHLSKAVDEKESTCEEELEHQIKMLRDEVCSIRGDIEKLSTIEDSKNHTQRDKLIDEVFMRGI